MNMKTLKSQIKKALTCDKNCGHTLKDTNACFEHQVERVRDLIEIEAKKLKKITHKR